MKTESEKRWLCLKALGRCIESQDAIVESERWTQLIVAHFEDSDEIEFWLVPHAEFEIETIAESERNSILAIRGGFLVLGLPADASHESLAQQLSCKFKELWIGAD